MKQVNAETHRHRSTESVIKGNPVQDTDGVFAKDGGECAGLDRTGMLPVNMSATAAARFPFKTRLPWGQSFCHNRLGTDG